MNNKSDDLTLKVCKCTSTCIISRKKISAGVTAIILEEYEDFFGIKMIRVLIDDYEGDCSVKYFFDHFYTLTTLNNYNNILSASGGKELFK
ncbi:MAG TPA: hypothetical protein PKD67_01940 [Ignavibacteriaceae bacterium]|nr:hypothetical protein [Ignavibacteriaceae bacterium]